MRWMGILGVLCVVTPVCAADSTPYANGGSTTQFLGHAQRVRESGELFRIKGEFRSACTMFLAASNTCIEPSATLMFHAGTDEQGTKRMMDSYNAGLRDYLITRKAMETRNYTGLSGRFVISRFGYRACSA